MIRTILGISTALIMCGWANSGSPEKTPGKKEPVVDTSDPESVAKAFIRALASKDSENAARYVIPVEREKFMKVAKKGMPPIPKKPDIRIRVKKDGVRADVVVVNAKRDPDGPPFGLDMKLVKGRWWVVI